MHPADATASTAVPATRVALVLAYDGSAFHGWQVQPRGATIQGEVARALAVVHHVGGERIVLSGSGRTDAGVHALGQIASYPPPTARSESTLFEALSALLPAAIRVLGVRTMHGDFHARRSAVGKIYRYRIVNRRTMLPFEAPWAWHIRAPLDVVRMRSAAAALTGWHDFASFASSGGLAATTIRDLRRLEVHDRGAGVVEIEAESDGFLYRMVRNLAGVLVEIGRGRRPVEHAAEFLAARSRQKAAVTAPPQGLCLVRVLYPAGLDPAAPDDAGVDLGSDAPSDTPWSSVGGSARFLPRPV